MDGRPMHRSASWWISGVPSSYSTTREKPWKVALASRIPVAAAESGERGLSVDFSVSGPRTGAQAGDIDNLCEPVFSVVINGKRWFAGRRPNLRWYRATKTFAASPADAGCRVTIERAASPGPPPAPPSPVLNGVYDGALPRSARDEPFADWVRRCADPAGKADWYGVRIRFGNSAVNIGDIASGPVKSIIDCLYPIIGGSAGSPEDWRVRALQVEKNDETLPAGVAHVVVDAIAPARRAV